MAKNNRKLDKKYKEAVLQAEEERRHADQYKEQVCVIVTFFFYFYSAKKPFNQRFIISSVLDI